MVPFSAAPFSFAEAPKSAVRLSIATALGLAALTTTAHADAPSVVTSIKPIHSIASAVMEGVGEPFILVDGAASPHGFALKPSQAFLLEGADVVFWVGPGLAASLAKPISSMASDAVTVELMDAPGIEHLGIREGATFDSHDHDHGHDEHDDHGHDEHKEASHDDHDHEKHDEEKHAHDDHDHDDHKEASHDDHDHDKHDEEKHAHDDHDHDDHKEASHGDHDHDDHKDEEHAHDDHGHDEHKEASHDDHDHDKHDEEEHAHDDHGHDDHGHEEGARDAHIWLNPDNGIAIANVMAETLAKADPDHADTYRANAKKFAERIEGVESEIAAKLEPVGGKKFIVFHDAYHHFEHHFDIEASGSVTLTPEAIASAERLAKIQDTIKDLNVTCVFQEPQFEAKLVDVAIEGSSARKGTIDPLGTEIANGPDLYPTLLKNLADGLADCLGSE